MLKAARAALHSANAMMDQAQRLYMERVFARKMAVRRVFLTDPRNVDSDYTKDGRTILAHLARQAQVLAPSRSTDAIELARVNGMQIMFGLILADLYDDLPDFARLMAQEEARLQEEIIA